MACSPALLLSALPASAAEPRVLAFGDSLTAGYGLGPDQGFTTRLGAALAAAGYPATVINAGISGDTSAGGKARLDWSLADHPDAVILELGENDALRGTDPAVTEANLDAILKRLADAHLPVLLCGARAPTNWGPDYQRQFDAIFPTLAAKWKVPLYPFFLDGVALDPRYVQADGLHPNEAGVAIIVGKILPAVEALLPPKG